jgi:hypothetical protein
MNDLEIEHLKWIRGKISEVEHENNNATLRFVLKFLNVWIDQKSDAVKRSDEVTTPPQVPT